MSTIAVGLKLLGIVLLLGGAFFFIAATVGVLRMPDPYNRGHVAGKGDSLGFILCLGGVWLYWLTINPLQSLKILVIIAFMVFANPVAIHSILRLCFRTGIVPYSSTKIIKGSPVQAQVTTPTKPNKAREE